MMLIYSQITLLFNVSLEDFEKARLNIYLWLCFLCNNLYFFSPSRKYNKWEFSNLIDHHTAYYSKLNHFRTVKTPFGTQYNLGLGWMRMSHAAHEETGNIFILAFPPKEVGKQTLAFPSLIKMLLF